MKTEKSQKRYKKFIEHFEKIKSETENPLFVVIAEANIEKGRVLLFDRSSGTGKFEEIGFLETVKKRIIDDMLPQTEAIK